MFARALLLFASVVLAARADPSPAPLAVSASPLVDVGFDPCVIRVAGITGNNLWTWTKSIKGTLVYTQNELILRIPHDEIVDEVLVGLQVRLCSLVSGESRKQIVFYERSNWSLGKEGYLNVQRPVSGDRRAWATVQVSIIAYFSWFNKPVENTILQLLEPRE